VSFVVQGRNLEFCWIDGRGPDEAARAVFGADKVDWRDRSAKKGIHPTQRTVANGVGYLRKTVAFGLATGRMWSPTSCWRACGAVSGVLLRRLIIRDTAATFVKRLGSKRHRRAKVALLSAATSRRS
jgi:hypothetical protein